MSDYQFITDRGVIIPDTAESRERVIELFRSAFGSDIDTDPSTPSGLLITMFTEQRDAVARNNAALANQINPEQSTGVFLDTLFGFTGGERNPATRSIINGVTLTGDAVVWTIFDIFSSAAPPVVSVNGQIGAVVLDYTAVQAMPQATNQGTSGQVLALGAGGPVWTTISITQAVDSVNDKTGAVTLTYSDVGAAAVNHTHVSADITDLQIPTAVSQLTNDSGYITNIALNGYATQSWVENKGYLVASDLDSYATQSWV